MGALAQDALIIAAPTAFKETLTPREAVRAISRGVRRVLPHARIDGIPVADGGDGTLEALRTGRLRRARVLDPLGRPIVARFGMDGPDAVVEMAAASGLQLVAPAERDPEKTTTFGTGQLLAAAFRAGARRVLLGVGGSATVDGGEGALRALGDVRLCRRITVLCDVDTRFLDAPRIFGPQKGASPDAIRRLERRLAEMAAAFPANVRRMRGGGAAGGLAGGLAAHGARLVPGAEFVLRRVGFLRRIRGASLVLTGEGRFDRTSLGGKIVGAVIRAAGRIPCTVLCGSRQEGFPGIELSALAGSVEKAMAEPALWLERAAEAAVRACR